MRLSVGKDTKRIHGCIAKGDVSRRFIVGTVLLTLLCVSSILFPKVASAHPLYTCNTSASQRHCYGIVTWNQQLAGWQLKDVYGAGSTIQVQPMVCSGYCKTTNDHLSNEVWLIDTSSASCTNIAGGVCLVEAGYTDTFFTSPSAHVATTYFWADIRNVGGKANGHVHFLPGIQSGDYGKNELVQITASGNGSGKWQVRICSPSYCPNPPTNFSTSNYMIPDTIEMGLEVSGTVGWASPANFTKNQYFDVTGTSKYETMSAQVEEDFPVTGSWSVLPENDSTGGVFTTQLPQGS
jgi:hypothetical protein